DTATTHEQIERYGPSGRVPVLLHGELRVWDSLAICEYVAELTGKGWPQAREARAVARSVCAEMHSGFVNLRTLWPMNARARNRSSAIVPALAADIKRISDPQLSPDGRQVAFVQRETDMDANKGRTSLWLLELTPGTAAPRRLTDVKANDSSPRWSPDSRTLYFLSTRSGSSQVWRLALTGGDAQRVTDYPLEVGALKVSPHADLM